MKLTTWISLLLTAGLTSTLALAQISYPNPITHVIIVDQENRTIDNLLGSNASTNQYYLPDLVSTRTGIGYQIVNGNKVSFTVPLRPIPLASNYGAGGDSNPADDYDPSHRHEPAWQSACDAPSVTDPSSNCAMDGFNYVTVKCNSPAGSGCPPQYPTYAYVQYQDVAPYFQIAQDYGYANYMFQTNQGPSFPSHQFIFGGTSQLGLTVGGSDQLWFVSENLGGKPNGCIAHASASIPLVNPADQDENTMVYPCFARRTMADLLASPPPPLQPITWTYYTPGQGSLWTAPDAISSICPKNPGGNCVGPYWTKGSANGFIDTNPADALTDINSCHLQQMNWIIPNGLQSDHAGGTDGSGPSWVASIVNAIGGFNNDGSVANTCGYWNNTVILITWDDWGGWYDHIVPPSPPTLPTSASSYVYGFRVPLLVVSAYTKPGTVSNVRALDFGAMLKFVEEVFGGLGTIDSANPNNPYADGYAQDDLGEFFNFHHMPHPFQFINAPIDSSVFLDPRRPIDPPDDDE
jgi:phospholipase C